MRRTKATAALAVVVLLSGRAEALITCEGASVDFMTSVVRGARYCLTSLVPRGRSCAAQNRYPNRYATRVDTFCPAGTVQRLSCTTRQALLAAGLPYDSLAGTGFGYVCTAASCGNGVKEAGEECDDANVINADGCSATCRLEAGTCSDVCAGVVPAVGTSIRAERVASGLSNPVHVTAPARDVSRVFIVEQPGTIRILKWGSLLPTPFLDIRSKVSCCGERGLLSMAFHPQYAGNGRFFVDYTDVAGNTVVAEYRVGPNPDVADGTSEKVILQVVQPAANHNGGQLAFGPDSYLYIALGDGGGGGDPFGNGQNLNALLGKLLRIDVDSASPYAIPPTNPFAAPGGTRDEIWALGLRNPWRFSFDRLNGDLYIGDVGQGKFEEVDYQPGASAGGLNYGWNIVEGDGHCFTPPSDCDQTGLARPILDYPHGPGGSIGCSVTGGFVYRGCAMPDLRGTYFYGDFCTAFIKTFQVAGGLATNQQDRTAELAAAGGMSIDSISSFGEDARGELFIADLGGEVFKIVPGP